MATIINNPPDTRPIVTDDSGLGIIVGLVVALVLIVLFVMYVLPGFQGTTSTTTETTPAGASTNINVTLPTGSTDTTSGTSNP